MRKDSVNWSKSKKGLAALYLKGICMGIADLIPGISGGTIALILGIYRQLIAALQSLWTEIFKSLFSLKFTSFFFTQSSNILFLLVVFSGILTSLLLASNLIHYVFVHHRIYTHSFFFGLVVASIPVLIAKADGLLGGKKIVLTVLGAITGYTIIQLVPVQTLNTTSSIIFSGFISIAAMILPGISGSFILVILGKYEFFINVLKNPFAEGHLEIIFIFIFGAALGLISMVQVLSRALKRFPHLVICFLTGLVLGSSIKIWPWKKIVDSTIIRGKEIEIQTQSFFPEWSSESAWAFGIMLVGALFVIFLERVKKD